MKERIYKLTYKSTKRSIRFANRLISTGTVKYSSESRHEGDNKTHYQEPLRVTEAVYFTSMGSIYPRCPNCRVTLEREYMAYCDRCSQALDWKDYDKALIWLK